MLRRFQPISRAVPWTAPLAYADVTTGEGIDLTGAVLTAALYQEGRRGCGDYGRWWGQGPWRGYGAPIFAAQSQADGGGQLVILPGASCPLRARLVVPAPALATLRPGTALLIVWAAVSDQVEEIERTLVPVLDGPTTAPY